MTHSDEHGRIHPPGQGDELATLTGFLEYQRATFAWKTQGLDAEGLRRCVAASTMTLGGMIKHLALVEDYWFGLRITGEPLDERWRDVDVDRDPDWEWSSANDDAPDWLYAVWTEMVERSRTRLSSVVTSSGLAHSLSTNDEFEEQPSARWVICHMIEEYARHNGHADLIRESIDGEVGE